MTRQETDLTTDAAMDRRDERMDMVKIHYSGLRWKIRSGLIISC